MFLALCVLLVVFPAQDDYHWSKIYAIEGVPRLRVETGDANIHVTPRDAKSIEAKVTSQRIKIGGDGIQILEHQAGDSVEMEVRFPRRWFQMNFRSRRVDVDLYVPAHTNLDIRTGDGNVDLRDVNGEITLRSGDGHLVLANTEGSLRATTGDGPVELRTCRGDVTLKTGDGKVNVENADGNMDVETGDGKVRVSGRFNALRVKTGDGGVEVDALRGSKLLEAWTLSTGDGGLTLRVPDDLAADVDLHTGDGKIDLGVPVAISGRLGEKTIKGQLNGGGKLLTLRTGDGSIHLDKLRNSGS